MTAKATKTPPDTTRQLIDAEAEFRRWTPDEVVAKRLLPYTSVRVLKQKCYDRAIHHHNDGGRITFTVDDLRKENERTAVDPTGAR
ncbi:hypothetical protein [Streptomyces sp. LNU-CPARS28]|uniref:hypothetical protein n=1 Tax=Streptomyces sp. LNU-CPARS28 TaxID=3137371 RepID=UPI003134FAFF